MVRGQPLVRGIRRQPLAGVDQHRHPVPLLARPPQCQVAPEGRLAHVQSHLDPAPAQCLGKLLDALKRQKVPTDNGYVPQLDTYIGPETPNPLFITLLRSKRQMPKMDTVLKDIVGLTKINYNSCNYNDSLPVTVRFAKMVGEVLTMGSAKGAEKQPFKFYV